MKSLMKTINAQPWPPARIIGDKGVYMFAFGTIHGLMNLDKKNKFIEVFTVVNEKPGNGKFLEFITTLEQASDEHGIKYSVSTFFNLRLKEWFRRRGYEYYEPADAMIYGGKA